MIFAGPWIGEFGWELFCWQGYLRKLAEEGEQIIVGCRHGHDFLYEDFALATVNYRPRSKQTDMWKCHKDPLQLHSLQGSNVLPADTYSHRWWDKEDWKAHQSLISFYKKDAPYLGVDVLMIVRDTNKCNTAFRNWPYDHAKLYAHLIEEAGVSVATIGTSDGALTVPGALPSWMNEPLSNLAGFMSGAKLIVGPQCGPTHFASLCELPQLCWQTKKEHAIRMQTHWNPFNVPVWTIPSSDDTYWTKRKIWTPDICELVNQTLRCLDILENDTAYPRKNVGTREP